MAKKKRQNKKKKKAPSVGKDAQREATVLAKLATLMQKQRDRAQANGNEDVAQMMHDVVSQMMCCCAVLPVCAICSLISLLISLACSQAAQHELLTELRQVQTNVVRSQPAYGERPMQ